MVWANSIWAKKKIIFEETKPKFYYFQSPILLFPKPKFIILKAQSFSKNIVIFTLTFYINFFYLKLISLLQH